MKIAKAINDVLDGRTLLSDADPSVQSCLRLPIYHKACEILELPKDRRRWEIDKAPPLIRPFIEDEIIRIWELRGKPK